MLRWLLFIPLAACFSPAPPTGVPCETDTDCPASQVCHTISHTCETSCDGCTVDAGIDGDAAVATCWDAWLSGTVVFEPPIKLTELLTANGQASNPSVTSDGKVIYFDRGQDFFRATRQSAQQPFDPPVLVSELRTDQNESRISTTADDQLAVFASARTGTIGLLDLWQATRGAGNTFGTPSAMLLEALNDTNNQFDPELTPDGLSLYWAPAIEGTQRIHRAARALITGPFKDETVLATDVPGYASYFDPSISPDQRVLVFAAQPAMVSAAGDLFFVTRASAAVPFGTPIEVQGINTDFHEGDSELSADGCTLYFGSNRDGGNAVFSADLKRP